jgi:hypothetical protein
MVIRQMEIGKKRTAGERVSAAAGMAHPLLFRPSANGPTHGTPKPLAPGADYPRAAQRFTGQMNNRCWRCHFGWSSINPDSG